jgi:septal ring factor EnvC (AmiA/AmiB activator)
MAILRTLFALLIGFIAGIGATVYMLHSDAGVAFIRATEPVQDMERRLRDMEQQRDQLGRQLEDVVARSGRMESSFNELERRFRELQHELEDHHSPAPGGPGTGG